MVANRARGSKKRKRAPLDANGHPIMEGIDMSGSEDPAVFWGKGWEAAFREADDDLAAGRVHRFASLAEMFTALDSGDPPPQDARHAGPPANADV